MFRSWRAGLVVSLMAASLRTAAAADDPLLSAVTFYASFDESLRADFAGGEREPRTRFNDLAQPGKYLFQAEVDRTIFRIAAGRGVSGGALEPADVLPRNGRIFYPLRGKKPPSAIRFRSPRRGRTTAAFGSISTTLDRAI
jgi:hypothetical protein